MKKHLTAALFALMSMVVSLSACGGSDDDNGAKPEGGGGNTTETVERTLAKGADVSWLTQLEQEGKTFCNAKGEKKECMQLLKELGCNAIRLRVWVNPSDGWCGKDDVLAKARRAQALGMRLMIDFHYSDSWADPGKQNVPESWQGYTLGQLQKAVAQHTSDVLSTLKANGIDVEWVQIGNETSSGMLWPLGQAQGSQFAGYVSLNNAGYDAAKSVYPDALCVIHLDRGQELAHCTWMFDGMRAGGAKWDVIGLSLYPSDSDWQDYARLCLDNMQTLARRYNTKVMLCEIGMSWDSPNASAMLEKMVDGCKSIDDCLGIFYWEPECPPGWNGYTLGAFDNEGKPTAALDAFAR